MTLRGYKRGQRCAHCDEPAPGHLPTCAFVVLGRVTATEPRLVWVRPEHTHPQHNEVARAVVPGTAPELVAHIGRIPSGARLYGHGWRVWFTSGAGRSHRHHKPATEWASLAEAKIAAGRYVALGAAFGRA